MRLVVVRGPEADWRPERHITDAVVAAAMGEGLEVEDPDSLQVSFDRLDRQDSFYDQDALVKNQQHVLGIYHRLRPDDIVYFSDAWNPAIPTLRYLLACQGLGSEDRPRFYGPLHSSVHFPADLLGPHASRFADALTIKILVNANWSSKHYMYFARMAELRKLKKENSLLIYILKVH